MMLVHLFVFLLGTDTLYYASLCFCCVWRRCVMLVCVSDVRGDAVLCLSVFMLCVETLYHASLCFCCARRRSILPVCVSTVRGDAVLCLSVFLLCVETLYNASLCFCCAWRRCIMPPCISAVRGDAVLCLSVFLLCVETLYYASLYFCCAWRRCIVSLCVSALHGDAVSCLSVFFCRAHSLQMDLRMFLKHRKQSLHNSIQNSAFYNEASTYALYFSRFFMHNFFYILNVATHSFGSLFVPSQTHPFSCFFVYFILVSLPPSSFTFVLLKGIFYTYMDLICILVPNSLST
jgi:hypothetical protein